MQANIKIHDRELTFDEKMERMSRRETLFMDKRKKSKLSTKFEEMINKITVAANLRNFSVWVPLSPETEKS